MHADSVMKNCGEPGRIELQKQLEDLTHLADDVNDMVRERGDELRKVYRHADQFTHLLDVSGQFILLLYVRWYLQDPRTFLGKNRIKLVGTFQKLERQFKKT